MEKKLTKKQAAVQLFVQMDGMNKSVARKSIVEAFMKEIGLTEAGAKTYVSNLRAGIWKVEQQEVQPSIDYQAKLNELSNSKFVELYNQKSEHHITKFRDKKTAVAKVMQLFGAEIQALFA